jgi:hypothetical protein
MRIDPWLRAKGMRVDEVWLNPPQNSLRFATLSVATKRVHEREYTLTRFGVFVESTSLRAAWRGPDRLSVIAQFPCSKIRL